MKTIIYIILLTTGILSSQNHRDVPFDPVAYASGLNTNDKACFLNGDQVSWSINPTATSRSYSRDVGDIIPPTTLPELTTFNRMRTPVLAQRNLSHWSDLLKNERHWETKVGTGSLTLGRQHYPNAVKYIKATKIRGSESVFHIQYGWYVSGNENPIVVINHLIFDQDGIQIMDQNLQVNSTSSSNNQVSRLKMSPNPAINKVEIAFENLNQENLSIKVYDISGLQVFQKDDVLSDQKIQLDVHKYRPGIYFVYLYDHKNIKIETQKLIVGHR